MATSGRMTIAFSEDTRELMDELLPPGHRTKFVDQTVREAIRALAQEKLPEQMAECAREMYDEIMELQDEFTPLEEEVHAQL